jgi:hypothetical protein
MVVACAVYEGKVVDDLWIRTVLELESSRYVCNSVMSLVAAETIILSF